MPTSSRGQLPHRRWTPSVRALPHSLLTTCYSHVRSTSPPSCHTCLPPSDLHLPWSHLSLTESLEWTEAASHVLTVSSDGVFPACPKCPRHKIWAIPTVNWMFSYSNFYCQHLAECFRDSYIKLLQPQHASPIHAKRPGGCKGTLQQL